MIEETVASLIRKAWEEGYGDGLEYYESPEVMKTLWEESEAKRVCDELL